MLRPYLFTGAEFAAKGYALVMSLSPLGRVFGSEHKLSLAARRDVRSMLLTTTALVAFALSGGLASLAAETAETVIGPTVTSPGPVTVPPPEPADIPPSPGDPTVYPGLRIWQPPAFTHWPAIAFDDETRNVAFRIPIPPRRELDRAAGIERSDGAYHNPFGWGPGATGSIAWPGSEPLPFTLPEDAAIERTSGLMPLPLSIGQRYAELIIGDGRAELPITLADARRAWPIVALENGFPVSADGTPVVLVTARPDPERQRQWGLLREPPPRPEGGVLLVGDPLEALGQTSWDGLEAEQRPVFDQRYPHHAALVALADLSEPLPRTICWSPGNQILYAGVDPAEETRLLVALRARLVALEALPDLVVALPPLPLEADLHELAAARRERLTSAAVNAGWRVVNLERAAGDPVAATQLSPGLHTRYPIGEAADRVRAALAEALSR